MTLLKNLAITSTVIQADEITAFDPHRLIANDRLVNVHEKRNEKKNKKVKAYAGFKKTGGLFTSWTVICTVSVAVNSPSVTVTLTV